ncbi:hypothetical protein LEP1GSC043_4613 [Leptospira weilii str. Ecochallenge]|uniref:Uncharacterized protein n=1 Tax=Leptospira weilii str. Ecochallenge TaxID=1049986 RepID=N1UC61_9LEPT|nr:hypothetical protein LEP1GSC043_4613 [Leptospira weilii str. Ecochallenge]
MKEYLAFFKDPKFWIPVLILVFLETGMQFGCYRPFLKKNSYAANVLRITNHVLDKRKELDPDVLVVGTSVAYQGLSIPMLNRELAPLGKKIQSIAIPGTELIVQDLAVLKTLPHFKNVRTVIHVFEITTPWVGQKFLNLHTLAMISEFDRSKVYPRIYDFGYDVNTDDLIYITLKSIAYRRDIQDLILSPSKRIKDIGKRFKKKIIILGTTKILIEKRSACIRLRTFPIVSQRPTLPTVFRFRKVRIDFIKRRSSILASLQVIR